MARGQRPANAIKPGQVLNPVGRLPGTVTKRKQEQMELFEKHANKAINVYLETIDAWKWELVPDVKDDGTPIMVPVLDAQDRPVRNEHGAVVMEVKQVWRKTYKYPNDARQRAADSILDRAYGKPVQHANVEGGGSIFIGIAAIGRDNDI